MLFSCEEIVAPYKKTIYEYTKKEIAIKDLLLESAHYKNPENKVWYLDQIARIMCGNNYKLLVGCCCESGDGWDCGISPHQRSDNMENNIKEAIKLLENNGYFVAKVPEDKDLCSNARECMETGYGECMDCSCFVCLCGCDM